MTEGRDASSAASLLPCARPGLVRLPRPSNPSVVSTGSVIRRVRRAPCSILVVPGSAQVLATTRARTASSAWTRSLLPHAFDAELAAFAVRNAGRRTTVEIVQNGHATRTIGQAMPLVSASYDAHDQAIALTFGSSTFDGAHLTHAVATPGSIDVMVDDAGREQGMRIVHPGGYTTLTLD